MEKEGNTINIEIREKVKLFLEKIKEKEVFIVSHFDTDGITSAAIMIKTLKEIDKKFSIKILKNLEREFIYSLPKDKLILFLDLGSGSLNHIANSGIPDIFIIDHHQIIQNIPENVHLINPEISNKQKISASGLTYLFCKEINPKYKELAKLAILGMIGDTLEKEIDKINNGILNDSEIKRKRGALIYPSTRPLNRALEYSSSPYIPGVTGDIKGVLELLREAGLNPKENGYPSLLELTEEEMERLVTAIILRNPKAKNNEIIGDIYLIKFFNKLEDAREISAKINACSRLGDTNAALQFCMEIPSIKKRAEAIHVKYKQYIVSALKFISESEKINGKNFIIINAKDQIKETIVGTVTSILSNSKIYEEGTAIITLAHYDSTKIKVSARNVGKEGRNVREILSIITEKFQGEVGGHEFAAGCLINRDQEQEFLTDLKKHLEIETIKIVNHNL